MGEKNKVMNGAGIEELGFPMWPQFAKETAKDIQEPILNGKVNYWTGPKGMEFEKEWAKWNGAKYAMSCTNGTAALHIALASMNIGPGDEVIVPSYSFIASSFAIVQAGAIPVFCDVTEDHTLDPTLLEGLLTKRTKAIIVVHLYGVMTEMDPVMEFARTNDLKVIEDCAQCFGGEYNGVKAGVIGDAGCFSFCQSKHFTTGGEGGMVVTNDEDLAWECRSFRDHGYDVKERMNMLALEEKLPYIHNRIGFNYRMTEIQSIIGLNELKRFDKWNLARRFNYANMYDKAFKNQRGISKLPVNTESRKNAYWWYPMILATDILDVDATVIIKELQGMGIPCYGIQWPEAYMEKAYKELNGFGQHKFPFKSREFTDKKSVQYNEVHCDVANSLRDRTINLFLHPSWEEVHIKRCIDAFIEVIQKHLV